MFVEPHATNRCNLKSGLQPYLAVDAIIVLTNTRPARRRIFYADGGRPKAHTEIVVAHVSTVIYSFLEFEFYIAKFPVL